MRDEIGRFLPGSTGNPGGRPRRDPELVKLASLHAADAVRILGELLDDKAQPGLVRLGAAREILDRAFGRAPLESQVEVPLQIEGALAPARPALTWLALESRLTALYDSQVTKHEERRPIGPGGYEPIDTYVLPTGEVLGSWDFYERRRAWVGHALSVMLPDGRPPADAAAEPLVGDPADIEAAGADSAGADPSGS